MECKSDYITQLIIHKTHLNFTPMKQAPNPSKLLLSVKLILLSGFLHAQFHTNIFSYLFILITGALISQAYPKILSGILSLNEDAISISILLLIFICLTLFLITISGGY